MALRRFMLGTMLLASVGFVNVSAQAQSGRMIGGNRDQHGCLPAAGYSWCGYTRQCERPWELASRRGFSNDFQSFKQFCNRRPPKRR